jgi:hypothetical protein
MGTNICGCDNEPEQGAETNVVINNYIIIEK